jgi:peroxiredoxin
MNALWMVSYLSLWVVVLLLGFLLLGTLRALGLLRWRLEQLEATTPSRLGRGGLKTGKRAPDFSLPSVAGGAASLHDFAGRRVFLVFTQSGCKPCHRIMPELNKLQRGGDVQVLVVNNGELEATRQWAGAARACFPVLVQEQFGVYALEGGPRAARRTEENRAPLKKMLSGRTPSARFTLLFIGT